MSTTTHLYRCPLCGREVVTDGTESEPPYCCHEPMELIEEQED
jgi:endogenous inhibitor of DNA gyrase (YacG/DUF329 family)